MDLNLKVEQRCHHDYLTVNTVNSDIENCVLLIDQIVPPRSMSLVEVICDELWDPNDQIDQDVFGFSSGHQKPEHSKEENTEKVIFSDDKKLTISFESINADDVILFSIQDA